jgi:hypothetical protein
VGARVAEEMVPAGPSGTQVRLRVDLHGISVFGPAGERTLIRWEWIQDIEVDDAVHVRSAGSTLTLPSGAFGLTPPRLAERLQAAQSLHDRADIIEELGAGGRSRP